MHQVISCLTAASLSVLTPSCLVAERRHHRRGASYLSSISTPPPGLNLNTLSVQPQTLTWQTSSMAAISWAKPSEARISKEPFAKANPDKLSFADIPNEVRNLFYERILVFPASLKIAIGPERKNASLHHRVGDGNEDLFGEEIGDNMRITASRLRSGKCNPRLERNIQLTQQ